MDEEISNDGSQNKLLDQKSSEEPNRESLGDNQVRIVVEEHHLLKKSVKTTDTVDTKVVIKNKKGLICSSWIELQRFFVSVKNILAKKYEFVFLLLFLFMIVTFTYLATVTWFHPSSEQTPLKEISSNQTYTEQPLKEELKTTEQTRNILEIDTSFPAEDIKEKKPNFFIGVGRADITGPPADVAMMGYASSSQVAGGLHLRLYARSIIIGQGQSRFVFVNLDACMGSSLVKIEILKRLKARYGSLYSPENICITATHTHSAPAGFMQDVLFQITSKGFVRETFQAIVEGVEESIVAAHESYAPGFIQTNKGQLLGTSVNRSPLAYLNNPDAERKKYKYDVDKDMILLKFLNASGAGIGMLNWFPVHCTSMNNSNTLITGDNKGYASLLFEKRMDNDSLVGKSKFVAIFTQSNEGDVSPNIKGPRCLDTGESCDTIHSTCNGNVQKCVASGPGKDMFESTKIVGEKQFQKALNLYNEATEYLDGPMQYVQQYIDMSNQTVSINSTYSIQTCKPAMGFSFAAGTTDGPGPFAFNFQQGDTSGNQFWRLVRNFIYSPLEKQVKCHSPKPILLDTGNMEFPYSWQSSVVDIQILRIGRLLVAPVPGEFTTMAGRRLRESILEEASTLAENVSFDCVLSGLANTYSDYITTYEEYQLQRYEGASTVFGPHTLQAYIEQYKNLTTLLFEGIMPKAITKPHDNTENLISFTSSVVYDRAPFGYSFGDVLLNAKQAYNVSDVVTVKFVSGNPRSSPRQNMTFLSVEKLLSNQSWVVIHTDTDWSTKFIWERSSYFSEIDGTSIATVEWEIPSTTTTGYYRIVHHGHYKYFWNHLIYSYTGHSSVFFVS